MNRCYIDIDTVVLSSQSKDGLSQAVLAVGANTCTSRYIHDGAVVGNRQREGRGSAVFGSGSLLCLSPNPA